MKFCALSEAMEARAQASAKKSTQSKFTNNKKLEDRVLVTMLLSRYLMRLLGDSVLIAVERLMGMILTTIAVQMFLSGVMAYLHVA